MIEVTVTLTQIIEWAQCIERMINYVDDNDSMLIAIINSGGLPIKLKLDKQGLSNSSWKEFMTKKYIMEEFEDNPQKIWDTNIFGKSLSDLVREGIQGKLYHMPENAQQKLQETLERIVNEGSGGLICIIIWVGLNRLFLFLI